ncbi:MAG TPA: phage/plasmid primase, P4 family, partial [Aquella sp.]|nr:phage/plasmid primase, P4 family [Aquella sp.]
MRNLSIRNYTDESDLTDFAPDVDPAIIDQSIGKIRDKFVQAQGEKKAIDLMGEDINFTKATTEKELVETRNLLKLLSKKRAVDGAPWYQVGRCLHNIDHRLLPDWIIFSKRCPEKFKQGECEILWRKMKPSNYTIATLHYFASRDSPKKYSVLQEGELTKLISKGEIGEHWPIAKVVMEKYKFRFKCASIKHNLWYEFVGHKWVKREHAFTLSRLISEDIAQLYESRIRVLYGSLQDKAGNDIDKIESRVQNVKNVIKKLGNNNFKKCVLAECANIAYDPNFLINLDESRKLICFENGVYDLEISVFRDGCPDDYISLSTGYNYIEYDENDEYYGILTDFLGKIQPNIELREYLLTLLSTCLAGSIREESFYVFTGNGANGKSKLMELLKLTLGAYYKPMDVRLLTERRSNSATASPEVADKKGIRACTLDEPNAHDEINTGFMKLFTGNDEITARALFQDPIYFKPQFKPFLLCNNLPNIRSDDDGTWRRLKVLRFGTKFVRECEATKSQKQAIKNNTIGIYLADLDISEKLPDWKQTFMAILLKYYKKYLEHGLIHPKLVLKYTNDYKRKCDVYQDFMTDCLTKTGDVNHTINMMNLHDL